MTVQPYGAAPNHDPMRILGDVWPLESGGAGLDAWRTGIDRDAALDFGRRHIAAMQAFRDLAARRGGGLLAGARVLVGLLAERGAITASDQARLDAMLAAFGAEDSRAGLSRVMDLHAESVADPAASFLALACSSVGAESARLAVQTEDLTDATGGETAAADIVGTILGSLGGPIGALGTGVGASLAVGGV